MAQLDQSGIALLQYLVDKLKRATPGKPQTYVTYKQVHNEMGLPLNGPTFGESLKLQGLSNLADWSASLNVPGITGLIIDSSKYMPGDGYFHLFQKQNDDFSWWNEQIKLSKNYDWARYLDNDADFASFDSFENWLIQVGKTPKTAKNYSGAISGSLTKWAIGAGLTEISLVEILSAQQILDIANSLRGVEIFQLRNKKGGNMYSCALKAYVEYLRDNSSEYIQEDISLIMGDAKVNDTEKSMLINARIGQGKFRKQLIEHWDGCAVTGYKDKRFLIASHIKPWRESNNEERLDPYNGFLLLPNLDKAFDLGYITFKKQGDVMVSTELQNTNALGISDTMSLKLDDKHQEYIAYHRDVVFKG